MEKFQKLERYPLGAIQARGFLQEQMLRGKNGICGHLHELEPKMIADPFINRTPVPAWAKGNQEGWGAEISGNYWTSYIQYAYTLNDPEMIKTASQWVNAMIKKQRADGYLGTYCDETSDPFDDYNAWGTASAMRGLLAFYEVTGRKDVLEAVYRCMLWFCEHWAGDQKTTYAGPFIIEPMILTYFHTGDQRLVDFSKEYLEFVCKKDIFKTSYQAMLQEPYVYNASHAAGYGCQSRLPALVYAATGQQDYLNASVRALDLLYDKSVLISGGIAGDHEYLSPVGATAETEYCSFAFYNQTYSYMSCITGDPKYGDRMEELFYNGAQGARKKDEKAIAYMSSPNQIYATTHSSTQIDAQAYAPCYPTSCCPVNAVAVIPEFIRGMLLHDQESNVYVMAYGPCSLKTNDVSLDIETLYPFRTSVSVKIACDKCFALHLKIPAFSRGYQIEINGAAVEAEKNGVFAVLHRFWQKGDTVIIRFQAEPEIVTLQDDDRSGKHPIAIRYGALAFAYHIPEKWTPIAGRPMTPLPDGWSWYDVFPDFQELNVKDSHERLGLRKETISWNVALDETLSPQDIEIKELPVNGYVWENPPISLHTHCYKAPLLFPPYPHNTGEPYSEYAEVTQRLPLILEPFGCTNLRITYFPKARLKQK